LHRITLDSPELAKTVRWSAPIERGRQSRRTFSHVHGVDGIKTKNIQEYVKTRRYKPNEKQQENTASTHFSLVYKPKVLKADARRASRASSSEVLATKVINGSTGATRNQVAPAPRYVKKRSSKFRLDMSAALKPVHQFGRMTKALARIRLHEPKAIMYSMAAVVFMAGMWVAFDGYITNKDIDNKCYIRVNTFTSFSRDIEKKLIKL